MATKTLLVTKEDGKEFKITVPEDSRTTFGPWSPPTDRAKTYGDRSMTGTLRIYKGKTKATEDVIAVFSGVASFRDITNVDYEEKIAQEVGATVWKSDKDGYKREESVHRNEYWEKPQLEGGKEEDLKPDTSF